MTLTRRAKFDQTKWLDYTAFLAYCEKAAAGEIKDDAYRSEEYRTYTEANVSRMKRLGRKIDLNKKLYNILADLPKPQVWYVFNEPWCGDASFIAPYLFAMECASAGKVDLRFVLRDKNLALMDQYLTDGGRSIPKVVLFEGEEEVGTWGPRPDELQKKVKEWMNEGVEMHEKIKLVYSWYRKDKGSQVQKEFIDLLRKPKAS